MDNQNENQQEKHDCIFAEVSEVLNALVDKYNTDTKKPKVNIMLVAQENKQQIDEESFISHLHVFNAGSPKSIEMALTDTCLKDEVFKAIIMNTAKRVMFQDFFGN